MFFDIVKFVREGNIDGLKNLLFLNDSLIIDFTVDHNINRKSIENKKIQKLQECLNIKINEIPQYKKIIKRGNQQSQKLREQKSITLEDERDNFVNKIQKLDKINIDLTKQLHDKDLLLHNNVRFCNSKNDIENEGKSRELNIKLILWPL